MRRREKEIFTCSSQGLRFRRRVEGWIGFDKAGGLFLHVRDARVDAAMDGCQETFSLDTQGQRYEKNTIMVGRWLTVTWHDELTRPLLPLWCYLLVVGSAFFLLVARSLFTFATIFHCIRRPKTFLYPLFTWGITSECYLVDSSAICDDLYLCTHSHKLTRTFG